MPFMPRVGVTSRNRIAPANGGHSSKGIGALGVLAVPILAVRPVAAAAPARRAETVHAAVVVIAGFVPHEAFKSPMTAIGKARDLPPFGLD